jgi:glyoxylase I family protein
MKLHHIAIQVFDLERANTFYQSLFGLREIRRQAHSIWLDLNGAILMLERCAQSNPKQPWKSEQPGLFVLALTITPEERQSFREKLAALGVEIEHETGFTLYFFDPDGNRLAVSHYPAPEHKSPSSP